MTDDMPRLPDALRRDLAPPPGGAARLHAALRCAEAEHATPTLAALRRLRNRIAGMSGGPRPRRLRIAGGLGLAGAMAIAVVAALPMIEQARSLDRLQTRLQAAIADSARAAPDVALEGFLAVRVPTAQDEVRLYRLSVKTPAGGHASGGSR